MNGWEFAARSMQLNHAECAAVDKAINVTCQCIEKNAKTSGKNQTTCRTSSTIKLYKLVTKGFTGFTNFTHVNCIFVQTGKFWHSRSLLVSALSCQMQIYWDLFWTVTTLLRSGEERSEGRGKKGREAAYAHALPLLSPLMTGTPWGDTDMGTSCLQISSSDSGNSKGLQTLVSWSSCNNIRYE